MKVVVLMGGTSTEREVSLASGQGVARALVERGHEVLALDTRDGFVPLREKAPAIGDRPADGARGSPGVAGTASGGSAERGPLAGRALLSHLVSDGLSGVDVAFVALHGKAGEDGTIQALLEAVGLPYTGSGVLASALAMHKGVSKRIFREGGVPTPEWVSLGGAGSARPDDLAGAVEAVGGVPVVVKPVDEGSTVGVSIVRTPGELVGAAREAARHSREILVEQYIPGRELTVGILGEEALPVVEITPQGGFYDFASKYVKGRSRYTAPAEIAGELSARAQAYALQAFRLLGAEGFGRVDFRLNPVGELFCLELNTIPGMTETSLVPMAAQAAGLGFADLVESIARLGLERAGPG